MEQTSNVSKIQHKNEWEDSLNKAKIENRLVVAHFGASWCITSVAMNSFFEEMAITHPDLLFLTVDVDDVKEVATKMEVKAMPTFILIKDCEPVAKLVGANPDELRKTIDGYLQSNGVDVA